MGKVWRIDSNHREIGVGVIADQLGRILPPVGQADRDLIRGVDNMAISQNETIRSDHESGTTAPDFARSALTFETLFNVEVNHRGSDAISRTHDRARIFIKH